MAKKVNETEVTVESVNIHGHLKQATVKYSDGSYNIIADITVQVARPEEVIKAETKELKRLKKALPETYANTVVPTTDENVIGFFQGFLETLRTNDDICSVADAVVDTMIASGHEILGKIE